MRTRGDREAAGSGHLPESQGGAIAQRLETTVGWVECYSSESQLGFTPGPQGRNVQNHFPGDDVLHSKITVDPLGLLPVSHFTRRGPTSFQRQIPMVSKESRKVGAPLLSQICSNYFTARHQGIAMGGGLFLGHRARACMCVGNL